MRVTFWFIVFTMTVVAQHQHDHPAPPASNDSPTGHQHPMPQMSGMNHSSMNHETMNPAGMFLMGESSGTSLQPSAWPMPMLMNGIGGWRLMWMGQAYLIDTQQSGPRGGDKFYSVNWGMLGAVHSVGDGAFMLRAMISLDPLTVTGRKYPLLFQTGEAAYGTPIVDGQHPHDLVMELSAQYAHRVGSKGIVNVYYAPVGDAALGPVAYPHRASALEVPQGTLAHHWQDSTHIANNVITAGLSWDKLRVEASGFRGQEPNENRWNIDMGAMDSWSARVSLLPTPNWLAQASYGHLTRPEQFHAGDVERTTASVHHVLPRSGGTYWATSLIWARNYKRLEKYGTQAVVAETLVPFKRRNLLTGRFEWSQRDELFEYDHELAHEIVARTGQRAFDVLAYTAGYTRDFDLIRNAQTGIGANFTFYSIDQALKPFYGSRPFGVNVFLRVRLRQTE